jgi:hypothetical protein
MADVEDLPAKVVSFQDEAKECLKLAQAEPHGGLRAILSGMAMGWCPTGRRGLLTYSREMFGGWTMTSFEQPLQDDDICISEEMIGRLHCATETSVLELVAALQANRRASLAMHCYRRSHLRQAALIIASTCELITLVRVCGPLRGQAIFDQSHARPSKPRVRGRAKITLACSAGGAYRFPVDVNDTPKLEEAVPA